MRYLYVIESRRENGTLDLSGPQPESVFGEGAITGMSDHAIANAIYRHMPDGVAVLHGDCIPFWPRLIDPRWTARRKTW